MHRTCRESQIARNTSQSHRLDESAPSTDVRASTDLDGRRRSSTVQVQIRLTQAERAQLMRIAADRDQTLSAVVRHWLKQYRGGAASLNTLVSPAAPALRNDSGPPRT